ncbi:MAG: GNAT family N-acetyltransferase [Candidatus Microsaccharimonas sp.]
MSEQSFHPVSHTIQRLDEFDLSRGFDEPLAERIVVASQQPTIRQMAPRDVAERFTDVPTAMEWYRGSRDRVFYNLGYRGTNLAGIIWFTKTPFQGADYTFAIRVYEPFVGNGLGTLFARATHDDFEQEYSGSTWADVHVDNFASQRLAHKVGYRRVDVASPDPTRLQLLRPSSDERHL